MMRRVVITGMGVVAPNAIGLEAFKQALLEQKSGIREQAVLKELGFACTLGGIPEVTPEMKKEYFTELTLKFLTSSAIVYGCMAGVDAWKDAGLEIKPIHEADVEPWWNAGCIFGTGLSGVEPLRDAIYKTDQGQVRRLGGRVVEQTMNSGISAFLSGLVGFGNRVTTNSSACSTGTEAIIDGFEYIKNGNADIMLCGSCDADGPYIWGGFDAMAVTNRKMNDRPEKASRPMSATAAGFIPGAGAGALVLEELEHAQKRGARIYAEVLGGAINNGGQRQGGTMTAPNSNGVRRCISQALKKSGITATDIDLVCGHLTATMGDVLEITNWSEELKRKGKDFPYINSLKSMVGHCLAAAGSIEAVAAILQLHHGFIQGNINCEDLHPSILEHIDASVIPQKSFAAPNLKIVAKSSFGFGDVNAVAVFSKF